MWTVLGVTPLRYRGAVPLVAGDAISSRLGGPVLVDVQVHQERGWTVVAVVGELDLAAAPRIRHAVAGAIGPASGLVDAPAVVLDLGSVHFIDSSGLGIVLGTLRRVRQAGGTLRVVVAEPQVTELFALLDLGSIVDLSPSVPAATAAPALTAGPGVDTTTEASGRG